MYRAHAYSLPLRSPLQLPGGLILKERRGVLLENTDLNTWGDAAPLPGFSMETVEDVLDVVKQGDFERSQLPSLRFARECASRPFHPPSAPVRVNALWIPASESLGDFSQRIRDWQDPVVKIKPGKSPDLQAIKDLLRVRPDVKLRIDGNRQWQVEETLRVYECIPSAVLDYFEEPLADPEGYDRLWERVPFPLALDESLLTPGGQDLQAFPGVKALVLKPTLLGNAADRQGWVEMAESRSWDLTWSSCFESGVGLWHLLTLAGPESTAGLDTAQIFARDLVSPSPLSCQGIIQPSPQYWQINV